MNGGPEVGASAAGAAPDWPATRADRAERLRARLVLHFAPTQLDIEDESHLHAGHAGAAGGHSHFRVRIVAAAFAGMPAVARHRLVYAAVGDLLRTEIHALALDTRDPAAIPSGPSKG